MKVTLQMNGRTYHVPTPDPGSPVAEVPSAECPHCGTKPLRVMGKGIRERTHDTYVADAVCAVAKCNKPLGTLRAKVDTIFGIEEDERVLNGRYRVY